MGFIGKFKKIAVRSILVLLVLALLAYLINATNRANIFATLFRKPLFVLEWGLTIPLLVGYVALIAWVYNGELGTICAKSECRWKAGFLFLLLLLCVSLIQVAIVQTLLFATTDQHVWLTDTAYFTRDYPFFAVPLLLYLIFAYLFPRYQLYRKKVPMDNVAILWQGWLVSKEPRLLLAYLQESLPPLATALEKIRLFDIVLVKSDNQMFEVYLSDGQTWTFPFGYGKLMHAILSRWFLKTDATHFVNMLYVDIHGSSNKCLQLDEHTFALLSSRMGEVKLREILEISRYLQGEKQHSKFCKGKDSLPAEGWDIRVVDLKRN